MDKNETVNEGNDDLNCVLLTQMDGDGNNPRLMQRVVANSDGTLKAKLSNAGVLQLSWSKTKFLRVKLSKGGSLALQLSETDILQVSSNDAFVLHRKLSETDILQFQYVHAGAAPQQLSEIAFQPYCVETDTDRMEQPLTETDILQLSEGDILRVKLRETCTAEN